MNLDSIPPFVTPTMEPWLAHKTKEWPQISINTDEYVACCTAAVSAGGEKADIKQAALDNIGRAAWEQYLEGSLGPWKWSVRSSSIMDASIRRCDEDSLKEVTCGAIVEVDRDAKTAEVALSGWMYNGELLALSEHGAHICSAPFRTAKTLKLLAKHLQLREE